MKTLNMAANRIIRDWTTSDKMDELSSKAEVFFTRLIMKADDHGCFHASAKLLNAFLFPLKDYEVSEILSLRKECEKAGLLKIYVVDGKNYLQIINFGQRLRTMKSKFPQPNDNPPTIDSKEPPELEEEGEEETEGEAKENAPTIIERNFDWFKNQIDEIWRDGLSSEKKLKLPAAIENAWDFLRSDSHRLKIIDSSGCKKLVNNAFEFVKTEKKNGLGKIIDTAGKRQQLIASIHAAKEATG